MTALTRPVVRQTRKEYSGKAVVVTLSPAGGQDEALLGLRLKGERTQYVVRISDVYRNAALHHAQREHVAKLHARRNGIPWRKAKKAFDRANSLDGFTMKGEA